MSEMDAVRRYTKEHEWAIPTGGRTVRVGITDYAQHQLGDIVFVELPETGAEIRAEQAIGTIESVKTVSDLFSPVTGRVAAVNEALLDAPELVNSAPYGEGWIVEVEVEGDVQEALGALLSAEAYEALIASEEG